VKHLNLFGQCVSSRLKGSDPKALVVQLLYCIIFLSLRSENRPYVNAALHYFHARTLPQVGQGLMAFYCALLKQHAPDLLEMSEFTRVKVNISQTS
jgi:hypothetical protein